MKNAKGKAGEDLGIKDGFCITLHRGFRMTFSNGWSISVQWGPGNYVKNRDARYDAPANSEFWPSVNAEIAMFTPSGEWYRPEGWDDDVKGWVRPDEVLRYMNLIASKPTPPRQGAAQ